MVPYKHTETWIVEPEIQRMFMLLMHFEGV